MANNNMMDIAALLKSYDNADLSRGMLDVSNGMATSQNKLGAAIDAMLQEKGNYTDNTMNWLRDMYGITATNKTEAEEQLAILKALGQGKSKGMKMMEGAKLGASVGSDLGSMIAQMLPESKETLAAGPRGFGVVGRK